MTKVADLANWMETLAPLRLSAEWDNTGLLLGDLQRDVARVMTCLTLTKQSVEEAVSRRADVIISHHPLPFKPLKKIITNDPTGALLWRLASSGISVYCPHTAWDSASKGINAQLAELLELQNIRPLITEVSAEPAVTGELGAGRAGDLVVKLDMVSLARRLVGKLPPGRLRFVDSGAEIHRVGIACGSGASLLEAALRLDCDLFLTGEATFHQCLAFQQADVSLLLIGHFASEKFAMDRLAEWCQAEFSDLEVWGSLNEQDPVISF